MIATTASIFMNEQLHWTLVAECSACHCASTIPLFIGVIAACDGCGARIEIDPVLTVFHRASGSGFARS